MEFKLLKLKFLQLLESEGQAGAIRFARANFEFFADTDKRGIQELMGSLVYLDSDPTTRKMIALNTHYTTLLADALWAEIVTLFAKEAGALQGFSVNSPLAVW